MSALRFVLALAAVIGLHSLGVRVWGDFAVYVDLFLILTVAWAFETNTLAGLFVGLIAGLAADAFTGAPFGLNGFANCLIGYSTALVVANLAKMNTGGVVLLYAVASLVQQIVLGALVMLLIPNGAPPPLAAVGVKVVVTAVLGLLVFGGRKRFIRAVGQWRQTKESQLRF